MQFNFLLRKHSKCFFFKEKFWISFTLYEENFCMTINYRPSYFDKLWLGEGFLIFKYFRRDFDMEQTFAWSWIIGLVIVTNYECVSVWRYSKRPFSCHCYIYCPNSHPYLRRMLKQTQHSWKKARRVFNMQWRKNFLICWRKLNLWI